jgi:hypothetical protein
MPSRPTIQRMVREEMRHLSVRTATFHSKTGRIVHPRCEGCEAHCGCRSAVVGNDGSCHIGGEGRWNGADPKRGGRPSNTVCPADRKEGKS